MAQSFYVYEHWRPDKNQCFYVGKGCGYRAFKIREKHKNQRYRRVVEKLASNGLAVEVRMVLTGLTESQAFEFERACITFWRSHGGDLCNMTDGGEGAAGRRKTAEEIERIASKNRGKKRSLEYVQRMSANLKGRKIGPRPPEVGRKISDTLRGKKRGPMSLAQKAAISAGNKGKILSAEHRAKISAAHTGKVQAPHTDEHRAKIGAAHRGRKDTPETVQRKRAAGRRQAPPSAEQKAKIAEAMKVRWQDPEYRERMIAAHKEYEFTEDHRAKLREGSAKRAPRSEEHKAKISASIKAWHSQRAKLDQT